MYNRCTLRWKNIRNLCYCLQNLLIYVCKYRHCLRLAFLFISFLALGWMQHSPTQAPHLTPCSIPTYLARWWPRTSRRSTSPAPATRGIRQTPLTEPLCSLRPRENQPIQVGDNLIWVKLLDDQWFISGSDWSDSASATPIIGKGGKFLMDHEYHEISDEESVAESPRFEVS